MGLGKLVKKVAGGLGAAKLADALGFGESSKAKLKSTDKSFYDVSKQVAPFEKGTSESFARQVAAGQAAGQYVPQTLQQLGQAALGQGPSIAEASLKATQDRNLAQQLASIQAARGGSAAANQRALLQSQGAMGRDLAQQGALLKMQEQQGAQQALLQQAMAQEQALQQGANTGFDFATKQQQAMLQAERERLGLANQMEQARAQAVAAKRGAAFSGLGAALGQFGGPMGGQLSTVLKAGTSQG